MKLRMMLRLIKFNALWLFKYRRDIPDDVWFAGEYIKSGRAVHISNQRLHIIMPSCPKIPNARIDGIKLDGNVMLRKGHFEMKHNCMPLLVYHEVKMGVELSDTEAIHGK